ncbi:uncharacterized protein LOC126973114 [Leptidea sinapis]|uniref:uncharacterized protein LOC126973114 n=1 Tax=Leptidea sinapis TaxID=189913 RepID=UPI00213BEC47|nr:uncharacterized protein LOC126973114 [Leptidea sinapis]
MADDFNETDLNDIENLKSAVKTSFGKIYASLKARELKTLRQLEVLQKQCDNKDIERSFVKNIHISYENEKLLLDNVSNYGAIKFDKLCFENSTFLSEDYVSPNDDHIYFYKEIQDISNDQNKELREIEEAALKEITRTEDCVCSVNIRPEDVARKFHDIPETNSLSSVKIIEVNIKEETEVENEDVKSTQSDPDSVKLNPTDDWLNSIKNQTETEPSQVCDLMEQSTIS